MYEKKASQHISSSTIPSTPLHYQIIRAAVIAVYADGKAFDRKTFAKKYGFANNRHTAAVLDFLATEGVIKRLDLKDGTATYCANFGAKTQEHLYRYIHNMTAEKEQEK